MKSNLLLILLTTAVTLLAVNLMQGRIPPTAYAAFGSVDWQVACSSQSCYAVTDNGQVYWLIADMVKSLGALKPGMNTLGANSPAAKKPTSLFDLSGKKRTAQKNLFSDLKPTRK